ncbi:MAG: tetratricopeptide repeat protein [Elusimicrobiaceae bacterium]|nr:tetratricopeptide repeat protein [Elusimicrobiaceae bacterium]
MGKIKMSEQNYISVIENSMRFLDKALPLCNEALQAYPKSGHIHYLKALILWKQYPTQTLQNTSFTEHIQQALSLNPLDVQAICLWAEFNEVLKNYDLALQAYSQAITAKEKDPNLYYKRAFVYHLTENFQEAIEDCTKAITLAGKKVREIYYAQRGASKRALQDIEGALQDYQNAVSVNPGYAGGFLDMSQIYYSQKKYQKALECANKAVEKAPNQPICYGIRADIKKAMNDLIGSLTDYQQVLFLNPKDTQIWKHIAYVQNLLLDQIPEGSSYLRVHLKSGHKAMLTHINGQVVTFLELPQK